MSATNPDPDETETETEIDQLTDAEIDARRKRMWSELQNVARNNSTTSFGAPKGSMSTLMTIQRTASTHAQQARDLDPLPHMHRILARYGMRITEVSTTYNQVRYQLEPESNDPDVETDGGREIDPEPHGYERHDDDETPALDEPIKVRFQGDSRVKWETRTLEPESADGHTRADLSRRANARQRTQVVIVTEGELASCWGSLQKHQEFCGKWGAHWGSTQKRNAALRVLEEINTAAADQGIDVDELDDSVTAFDEGEP